MRCHKFETKLLLITNTSFRKIEKGQSSFIWRSRKGDCNAYALIAVNALIDDLHISHNALGMEANIRVLLIRNSSSHSSLDVNGLKLPCLAATMRFTRLRNQDNSLIRSWY